MTNFSGENLNAACGGPQGGGMDSRRNGVAEVSPNYLTDVATNGVSVGYKQTEVGVIPEDWVLHSLDEVCSVIDGDRGNNYPNGSDFIESGYCVFLSATNVTKSGFRFDDVVFITKEKDGLLRKGKLLKGDIVLTTRGSIGNFAYFDDSVPFANLRINSGMVLVRCTTLALDAKYLFDVLRSSIVKRQLETMSFGSAQPQLTVRDINAFYVYFPANKEEQTAIANALSDVDALISELEKLIAKKQAIKTATMQQLLTGRTRLPQFALREDGTPKGTKPSELGEIPEDWEVLPLGTLASIKTGSKNNQDKVTDGQFPFFVRSQNIERLNSYSYDCEAILVPGEGGIGSIFHYINGKFDAHQRVYVIRDFKKCVGKYIYFQMKRSFGSHAVENSVKATVDSLRLPTFLEFTVLLPSEEEQTAIATILSDMDEEIQALEQRLGKTRQIKQGMMQELLTGKTRLVQPLNKESQHG